MTEVHARVVGALDSRADVPSDSDSDAPREGGERGRDAPDPEDPDDEDDRTLAEVLGDVQTSANMIFSQRDVASAETKLRALARVPAGLLNEETLDEHLDATLAACRDDESLGDRRLVFTPERKKRLRVRLHETMVRPPMRGVGSGGAQAPREPVAARARKTELQRERRRRERDRRRVATRASTDTPAGVSPMIETTSNAPDAMGARKGSVDVVSPTAAAVVPAAVANAAEEEDAGARRTVAAPPRTTLAKTIKPAVDLCRDDDVPCMKCGDPSPCVDGAAVFVLCSNEDVGDGTPCQTGGHYWCLGLKRMPREDDDWFCSEACLRALDRTQKTPPSSPAKGKAPASEK